MNEKAKNYIAEGEAQYQQFQKELVATPELKALYQEEANKKDLWLQLVEARQKAGLTQVEMARRLGVSQSQVARIEKRGYDAYTLTSLRRYVEALGSDYVLEVRVFKAGKSKRKGSTSRLAISP